MSYLGEALRLVTVGLQHPVTQRILKYALRQATAEVVRHIQRHTRGRSTKLHYS